MTGSASDTRCGKGVLSNSTGCPQLLVSVRDSREASVALHGGCQIVDIKDPSRGSLGMASVETIGQIVETVRGGSSLTPTSAALGELRDWLDPAEVPTLPRGLGFLKLGLAGLGSLAGWPARYAATRQRFEQQAERRWHWVAVAYADWPVAESPPPSEVVAAAAGLQCPVVLIDTCLKDHRRLTDWLSIDDLRGLSQDVHHHGMALALAGRLTMDMIADLVDCRPDILAIRSAAIPSGRRAGCVTADAVSRFRQQMERAFAGVRSSDLFLRNGSGVVD